MSKTTDNGELSDSAIDTQEASSLHELDGRTGRMTDEQQDKRWEVWVKTTRGPWTRSRFYATKEAAMIHVGTTIRHGFKKSEIAVMEVVVVARTETVVTRKVCSPSAKLENHL